MHCEMEGARKARRVPAPSLSVGLYVCLESVASRGQDVHHAGAAVRGEQCIDIDSQQFMHARLYPAAAGCILLHLSLVSPTFPGFALRIGPAQ
jgi:hypothetical protein